MIERYLPTEMAQLWSERAKWERVLLVELAVADVLAEDGVIPRDAADRMRRNAAFDLDRMAAYERVTRHDLIAFLQSVGDSLGEDRRWLHLGLTSYDAIDTALSIALVRAGEMIVERLERLRQVLAEQARRHRNTLMPGRTHGMNAEVTTLGWKICGWLAEVDRDVIRMLRTVETVKVGKVSGAVGTYPHITPDQERRICERLGLLPETVSTQVIPRDRHAEFIAVLALVGGTCERIALEVRLLQHSEVEELEEPFEAGQRGSSAMPHKRNPVAAENICGLVRLLRSYMSAAMENMALWHERDISHSSVERIILPDATALLYYLIDQTAWLVGSWRVNVARMQEHIRNDRGLMSSGALLTALKLAGIEDEDVYQRVQGYAQSARERGVDLAEVVRGDAEIVRAVGDKWAEIFNPAAVLARADLPLRRLGLIDRGSVAD